MVAIALGGSEEDMKFVDRNPMFELYDAEYVLDPRIVSANDRFVGINAAVAVDLTGQIAAESVGPAILSGPGGQLTLPSARNYPKADVLSQQCNQQRAVEKSHAWYRC